MEKFDKQAIDEKVRHAMPFEHRWHNRFHLEMPFGLINDPNGLAYYNGEYHIFYQWNPLGCVHKNKCWAHVRTRDFVTYSMPELALWPTDVHDKDGCYSGCGLVENGQLRVLYTCNSKDEQGVRTAAQRFGTWMENGSVRKDAIIVPGNPEGFTAHFRDPNIFYHHGVRHFVLGAQRENETGTVLVYREEADGWKLLGELKTEYSDFGYMWECPGLLKFGSHDVLLFCPQGLEAQEYQYQNVYQSGYIAGHVSLDSMEMIHGKFQELDRGFDFYAPQV
ncbi:MAG: glycoside hydrolase family 32 protein, partial [Selenomonadaceae bacterium]|nr:glycoside hydrolase family 32 protein [Selenomonadaceae bacterium]